MGQGLSRLGGFVARHAWAVIGVWAVLIVVAGGYGRSAAGMLTTESGYSQSADSWKAFSLLQEAFPGRMQDLTVVFSSSTLTTDDAAFRETVGATLRRLPTDQVSLVQNGLDAPPGSGLVSSDGHAVKVFISLPPGSTDDSLAKLRRIEPLLTPDNPAVRADPTGILAMARDITDLTTKDLARAERIAFPVVALLSLLIFGSLPAAMLPSVIGGIAMLISLATLRAVTTVTAVSTQALSLVSLLAMGLAIDYCLFVINRFREELGDRRGRAAAQDAVAKTLATAGRTVVVSSVILAVCLAALVVFPLTSVRSLAYGAVPAVLGAMGAAVVLLPAILALLGHRINALRIPGLGRVGLTVGSEADEHGPWARIARHVMRRPWTYLISVTVTLIVLGLPFLGVRWGYVDEMSLPADAPSRVALRVTGEHFGGNTVWAYVMVDGADEAKAASYASSAGRVPGVGLVVPNGTSSVDGRPVSRILVTWEGEAQSSASQDLVRRLRMVPAPDGARAYVGGPSALTLDAMAVIKRQLPWMVLVVGTSMLVLLFAAFRSVLLPIKSVIVSAISITASFGVVTWVFQDGHLGSLLGISPTGYLEVTMPIVMAAILFGLSMDYEVFLLSRVREEWDRTGDNTGAVAHGLARTGRIITGAALLLAVVIGAFTTSSVVLVKMLGLGMLIAVLLDATVVRCLLVPAAMKLLGHRNWWLPGRPWSP